jgi:hypothetical protein
VLICNFINFPSIYHWTSIKEEWKKVTSRKSKGSYWEKGRKVTLWREKEVGMVAGGSEEKVGDN